MTSYMEIGHGDPKAILWLCDRKKIQAFEAGEDTHSSIWGAATMNKFRGRYDKKTDRLSIMAPVNYTGRATPTWLLDLLEEKFGTGFEIYEFNPKSRRVR